jgi:hypothetical protein
MKYCEYGPRCLTKFLRFSYEYFQNTHCPYGPLVFKVFKELIFWFRGKEKKNESWKKKKILILTNLLPDKKSQFYWIWAAFGFVSLLWIMPYLVFSFFSRSFVAE